MGTRDIRGFDGTLLGAERSPGWERGIPGWRHKQLPPRFSSSLEAPKKTKRSFKVCKNEQKPLILELGLCCVTQRGHRGAGAQRSASKRTRKKKKGYLH